MLFRSAYVWRIWCGTMRALIPAAVATSRRALRSLRGNMYWPRDQLTDQGVDGNPALGFELAEGYMDSPLVGADSAQTIDREIDTFADAHAGMTDK